MARPIVALLTDFGTRDHYAGTMKGVVLGLAPDATLVDITHEVPPHDVLTASCCAGLRARGSSSIAFRHSSRVYPINAAARRYQSASDGGM